MPAYLSVVDIAGLVKGAHEGQVSVYVSECEDIGMGVGEGVVFACSC